MKPLRVALVAIGAAAAIAAVLAVAAFSPRAQTWAARLELASRPALHGSLGSMSADLGRVELSGLHFEIDGAVVTVPSLTAELPVLSAAFGHQVLIRSVRATGWTIDLTKAPSVVASVLPGAPGALLPTDPPPPSEAASPAPANPAREDPRRRAVLRALPDIFAALAVPFDLTVDRVDLEGEVVLPASHGYPVGRARVVMGGGGLRERSEGIFRFDVAVKFIGAQVPVEDLSARGTLVAAMDSPRTFTRIEAKADAAAAGPKFPGGVRLSADVAAARGAGEESYTLTLARGSQRLASVLAGARDGQDSLVGTWTVDLRDTDLTPFALGHSLPKFTVTGEGGFDADPMLSSVHARGRLAGAGSRLGVVQPALEALGAVTLSAEFDLARHGDALRVDALTAILSGDRPAVEIRSLQPFEFNPRTGELKVADPLGDLVAISLRAVPLAWGRGLFRDFAVKGGDLRGEFVLKAGSDGLALRPKSPVSVPALSASRHGRRLLSDADLSVFLLADYSPQGWQAQIAPLDLRHAGRKLLTIEARVGRLAGPRRAIKAEGAWSAGLAAISGQPLGSPWPTLTAGEAVGDFTASLDDDRGIHGKVTLSDLAFAPSAALPAPLAEGRWPTITIELRADIAAGGKTNFHAPIRVEGAERVTELTAAGNWAPAGSGGGAFDLQLTSAECALDDLKGIAALLSSRGSMAAASPLPVPSPAEGPSSAAAAAPFWGRETGRVTLGCKRMNCSGIELRDLAGTVRVEAGAVTLESLQGTVGDGCSLKTDGALRFEGAAANPYSLQASVAVDQIESGPLFRALDPGKPPTIEGRFDLASRVSGRGRSLPDLADRLQGDFQLTSKGGLFRGLRTNLADSIRQSSLFSDALDSVFSLFGKKSDKADSTIKLADKPVQAIGEFTKHLGEIHYDQVHVSATRGPDLDIHITEFTLIAPEERLTGQGLITHQAGVPIFNQPFTLDLRLAARDRTATLLGVIGLLKDDQDDLGYTPMNQPIHLGGTLENIDQSQWKDLVLQAAIRRASGLFDKLRGK